MGNRRLPTIRHQPRSQKAGHHPKGFARPISERNLIFSYELETWWLAGCRHDQQQALSRRRGSKWICVPIDCLQRLLGHGHLRRLRAVLAKVPYSIRQSSSSGSRSFMAPTIHSEGPKRRAPLPPDSCAPSPQGPPGMRTGIRGGHRVWPIPGRGAPSPEAAILLASMPVYWTYVGQSGGGGS